MPMVNGKEFPYTKKGMAAAKKAKSKVDSDDIATTAKRQALQARSSGYVPDGGPGGETMKQIRDRRKPGGTKDWTEFYNKGMDKKKK